MGYFSFVCKYVTHKSLWNSSAGDTVLNSLAYFLPLIFQRIFGVSTLQKEAHDDFRKLASAIYLQVSTISQALIFVTRSRSWSYVERPGLLLVMAFVIAQLVSGLFQSSHAVCLFELV